MKFIAVLLLMLSFSAVSRAQCDTDVRVAFGGVSSVIVYNTYIAIGAIADAYVDSVYTASRVKELMDEQSGVMQSVIEMLSKCKVDPDKGLTADDMQYLKELITCLQSLKREAESLSGYVSLKSQDTLEDYLVNRDKAWSQIKDLQELD